MTNCCKECRDYDNDGGKSCLNTSCDCHTTASQGWEQEFDATFLQDDSGEKISGWLGVIPNGWGGDYTIATPEKVKEYVRHQKELSFQEGKDAAVDYITIMNEEGYVTPEILEAARAQEGKEQIAFPCNDPELTRECTGCTDRNSEGTHQGCTKQHGHIGCDKDPK